MKPVVFVERTTRLVNMGMAWCILACVLAGCKNTVGIGASAALTKDKAPIQTDAEPAAWHDFQQKAAAWRAQPVKPPFAEKVKAEQVLAENAFREKHLESAVDHYENGLALDPLWPEGHFNVAQLYAELQDYYPAIWHLRAFLELAPESADARAARDQIVAWQDKLKQPGTRSSSQIWIDPETRLMWTRRDNGQPISWREAGGYCHTLSLGGLTGWRLPTLAELEGLYDPAQRGDGYRIKGGIQLTNRGAPLFGNDGWRLWSSNVTRSPEEAWYFSFSNGAFRSDRFNLSTPMRALCVRYAQRMF